MLMAQKCNIAPGRHCFWCEAAVVTHELCIHGARIQS